MTKKTRQPVEFVSINAICPTTGEIMRIKKEQISFRGWSQECETCGSHGGVDMDIGVCPACGKTHPVTVLMGH